MSSPVTAVLASVRAGENGALDRLFILVYDDLRRRAHRELTRGGRGRTLATTALVHEAYLKLVASEAQGWENRMHFFCVAAHAMRQIIVDQARRRLAQKRGGGLARVDLDEHSLATDARVEELVALDAALEHLAAMDARLGQIVELRFFAGLSVEDTAKLLDVSDRTVKRDWRTARAFLHHELE